MARRPREETYLRFPDGTQPPRTTAPYAPIEERKVHKSLSPRRYSGTYRRKRRQREEIAAAQDKRNRGEIVESPEKPMDRLTITRNSKRDGKLGGPGGSAYKPGDIDQKNVMWVRAQKDPKTGKTVKKGYLAYRNDHTRSHVTDPETGKKRLARRGDVFSGTVRISQPGSTYLSGQSYSQRRGGQSRGGARTYDLATYAAGRNVNSPGMKKPSAGPKRGGGQGASTATPAAKPKTRLDEVRKKRRGLARAKARQAGRNRMNPNSSKAVQALLNPFSR